MFVVNSAECIGCGACIKDCSAKDIILSEEGKAYIKNETCFNCGHCIAICPMKAVSTDDYPMKEVLEYNEKTFTINPDTLLNFIKFRRTIRQFEQRKIEKAKIEKIIEAGRFTPTASNSQNVSYIVVHDRISDLRDLTLETLNNFATEILSTENATVGLKRYAKRWQDMYEANKNKTSTFDGIFFNAPTLIMVVSEHTVNAGLASTSMELMINALGLGAVYSGFFTRAAESNPKISEVLGLKPNQKVVTCLVVGYPDVKYKRTVPRKVAEVTYK